MAKDETGVKLLRMLDKLRSSHLFLLVGSLFLLDLFIPDPIPFVDEAILFLLTALVARWQIRKDPPPKPPPKNVTPPG